MNRAPTMGAYCIVFMTVGCSVPDLALVGGGFISPACISTGDLDISKMVDFGVVVVWRAP
ncbi:hypothetical protein [Megasphaera cerevisiae]|uniref:hypothetical protein n=1 Tax=Megasphaera cerevisiae TaxID=39029 RepID=UPI0009CA1631|nr:hypothetical protein [Megasphaera cerevisiae]SKA26628.1 hypothetical protein SAMN05660900_03096 [Megasphaera cerevisiae DSM 20462]